VTAFVIDISTRLKKPAPTAAADPEKPATLKRTELDACQHGRAIVDAEKRIVTCEDCGAILDPFAYILELYGYYETRVDRRLQAIQAAEKRQKERDERRQARESAPRRRRIERRAETAERAAYNEYQAKLLAARAERQRQIVERLDREIAALPADEAAHVGTQP
jgi:Skp family chaperone for outer membrane proteins